MGNQCNCWQTITATRKSGKLKESNLLQGSFRPLCLMLVEALVVQSCSARNLGPADFKPHKAEAPQMSQTNPIQACALFASVHPTAFHTVDASRSPSNWPLPKRGRIQVLAPQLAHASWIESRVFDLDSHVSCSSESFQSMGSVSAGSTAKAWCCENVDSILYMDKRIESSANLVLIDWTPRLHHAAHVV